MTLLPRYRYEFYRDNAEGDTQAATWYKQRAQWLIFDAHAVGCMCSVGTEREAARIVFALNKLDGTREAAQFEEIPWREQRQALDQLVGHNKFQVVYKDGPGAGKPACHPGFSSRKDAQHFIDTRISQSVSDRLTIKETK